MAYFWILLVAVCVFGVFYLAGRIIPEEYIKYLDNAGIILGYLISCLSVGAAAYAVVKRREITKWFKRPVFPKTGEEFEIPEEKVEAVVIPVSRKEQPEYIVRHLKPKHVGLLYTDISKSVALDITNDFGKVCNFVLSTNDIQISKDMITNPDDPSEAKELTRRYIRVFEAMDISKDKIFVDTTGGKVPMSIGAFLGAEEEGVSSIYIVGTIKDPRRGSIIKDPKNPHHGRPIFVSDRTGA